MQSAALIIVIAAGLWLAGVGALMAFRPGYCLELCVRNSKVVRSGMAVS